MNKRKSKRQECYVPVDGKTGGVFDQTQTVDISKGGLGFISRRKIPLDKEIPIELDMGDNENPIFVIGKVKWVRPLEDSDSYRVGVIFKDVLKGSKTRLQQYFK